MSTTAKMVLDLQQQAKHPAIRRLRGLMGSERYDRSWARAGAFLVETDAPSVRCGICLKDYALPYMKADHLRLEHGAKIERHVDAEGNIVYTWRLP